MVESLLNQIFDKIVCISLIEREDKKQFMQKKFEERNIKVEWYRPVIHGYNKRIVSKLANTDVSHFNENQPNEIGTTQSHYTVIKTALLQGVKQLFVFEDDLNFINDWDDKLKRSFNKLPENWDMIMFYSFMYRYEKENIRLNSKWLRAFNSWSLTSYGMNRKMMKAYVDYHDVYFTIADKVTYELQKSYNVYVATPPLTLPCTSLGSNIRQEMNYKSTPSILCLGIDETNYI